MMFALQHVLHRSAEFVRTETGSVAVFREWDLCATVGQFLAESGGFVAIRLVPAPTTELAELVDDEQRALALTRTLMLDLATIRHEAAVAAVGN